MLGAKLPPVLMRGNLCSFQIAGKKFFVLSRAELSRLALVTGKKLTPVIAELLYALKNQISLAYGRESTLNRDINLPLGFQCSKCYKMTCVGKSYGNTSNYRKTAKNYKETNCKNMETDINLR